MLKLIKLEWKKNNTGKYIRNAAIMTIVLLIFIMAMAVELDADSSMELYGRNTVNVAVELFTHMAYIIFTGVMLASFVIGAYEKKTIHLMFSYPIKRQKIMLTKILAVWIFNYAALVLSKLLIYGVLYFTRPLTGISADSIQFGFLSFWLKIILSSAAMISITFIALLVGMKMKSSKAAIVASVIIVCFTQWNIGTYSLAYNVPFYILLFVLSVISVFLSIYHIEKKDVIS